MAQCPNLMLLYKEADSSHYGTVPKLLSSVSRNPRVSRNPLRTAVAEPSILQITNHSFRTEHSDMLEYNALPTGSYRLLEKVIVSIFRLVYNYSI